MCRYTHSDGQKEALSSHPPTWSGAAHVDRYKLSDVLALTALPWASVAPSVQGRRLDCDKSSFWP